MNRSLAVLNWGGNNPETGGGAPPFLGTRTLPHRTAQCAVRPALRGDN